MDQTDWRLEVTVQVTNGDYRNRGEADMQIDAAPDVVSSIDVTPAIKKLVANAINDLKAKLAERARQEAALAEAEKHLTAEA